MSQTWTDDVFSGSHTYSTDLGNMEDNFAALKSFFSGTTAPSSPVAFHPWADSSEYFSKYRNADNTAWVGIMHADLDQKIWFYVDSAMDGWVVDSSISDKVLALKGGTIYTIGGVTAGTFSLDALDHNHNYLAKSGSDEQQAYDSGGNLVSISYVSEIKNAAIWLWAASPWNTIEEAYTAGISDVSDWYPAAAVGTLQYMDL